MAVAITLHVIAFTPLLFELEMINAHSPRAPNNLEKDLFNIKDVESRIDFSLLCFFKRDKLTFIYGLDPYLIS